MLGPGLLLYILFGYDLSTARFRSLDTQNETRLDLLFFISCTKLFIILFAKV